MSPLLLFSFVIGYFLVLLIVAYFTSRGSNNESFFIGNKNSNWILVAFGMIGTSLSGVTFVSVPGGVGNGTPPGAFNYFQIVIGYFIGYLVIAFVLLPLYYRMNLTSIYKYLEKRFGISAHKTGSSFFILSRTLGATARLYLVVNILQIFILENLHVPFWLTSLVILLMILLYTFEGGVKTIVYTDTLQTTGMLVGLVICVVVIMRSLNFDLAQTFEQLRSRQLSTIFNMDVKSSGFFLKQILGGAVITIAMTGLDQEMMQKNISVNKLHNSQKNMMSFSAVLVFVNLLFLLLGGLLYLYASSNNISIKGDDLFPHIAINSGFSGVVSVIFIIALISALFPSVDGAITALTSSFCIDILDIKERRMARENMMRTANWLFYFAVILVLVIAALNFPDLLKNNSIIMGLRIIVVLLAGLVYFRSRVTKTSPEKFEKQIRLLVHFTFAVIFYALVILFKWIDEKSIIDFILKVAGFTYGPLLGLFAFGILSKRAVNGRWVALVCIAAVFVTFLLDFLNNPQWYEARFKLSGSFIDSIKQLSLDIFSGYKIGIELLLINGIFTYLGMWMISRSGAQGQQPNLQRA